MDSIPKISWIFFDVKEHPTGTCLGLAERLAKNETVVIVNRAFSLLRGRRIPPLEERCVYFQDSNSACRYRPLHLPQGIPGLEKLFQSLNIRHLRQEINQLLPHDSMRIACFDVPTQDMLAGRLRESLRVYIAQDDLTVTLSGKEIAGELAAERRLLPKVDLVVCVSETLAGRIKERVPSPDTPPILVLPNGYDEGVFTPHREWKEPEDLGSLRKPRILVAGTLSERIDWEGIARASKLRPHWTWMFVGPGDRESREKLTALLRSQGFYHPAVPMEEVPAWIDHCEVTAIPYRLNSFTAASNPVKAIEYLAMGAPVLSTRVPSLMRFGSLIEWVNEGDGESYARALDRVAEKPSTPHTKARRHALVAGESRQARFDQFREAVLSHREWRMGEAASAGGCR